MIIDIWTVMRKEFRELAASPRCGLLRPLVLCLLFGLFGIILPWRIGRAYVEEPWVLIVAWAWLPLLLVTIIAASSFAGEREHHTLETLLTSRLSIRALLIGKVTVAILYGWGLALTCLFMGFVAVWLAGGHGLPSSVVAQNGLYVIALSLLVTVMAAPMGILMSLRAKTALQAQEIMGIAVLVVYFGAMFAGQAVMRLLPAHIQIQITHFVSLPQPNQIVSVAALVILVTAFALLAAARLRLQRAIYLAD